MTLRANGITPTNIFELLGRGENSATFALGWAIQACGQFRRRLLDDFVSVSLSEHEPFVVDLQRHAEDGGYTDIEIVVPNRCHIVVEAKKGWILPEITQLARYVPRLRNSVSETRRIVSLSAVRREHAERTQPLEVEGIDYSHRAWSDVRALASAARRSTTRLEEKLWLRDLIVHLRGYEQMTYLTDNTVYVVSLGADRVTPENPHTWIDVVTRDQRYFHPVGRTWPVEPPNYIGFRYHGRLQTIHHVEAHEVVVDVSTVNPNWCTTNIDHFVYTLGPPMRPPIEVRSGPLWHRRAKCAIDTLLSGAFQTISDAEAETNRRLAGNH